MKAKHYFLIGASIVGLALIATWIFISSSRKDGDSALKGLTSTNRFETDNSLLSGAESQNETEANIPIVSPDPEEQASYVKLFKEVMGWGRTPIAFYGKVVDEGGRGIPGAEIKISINDSSPGGTSVSYQKSDGQGQFVIRDVKGKHLYIETSKEGYYDGSESYRGFQYAGVGGNFSPDPNNPEIFRLRKMGERVPLVTIRNSIGLPKDGKPTEIDLLTGKKTSPGRGDLVITATTGDVDPSTNGRFPWRWELEVPGGGLQAVEGEFLYQAPSNGYLDRWTVDQTKLGSEWRRDATQSFYVRTRNGSYARLKVHMVPGGDHFVVLLGYLNPDGSRNLEPDPERPIQVKTHPDGSVSLIYPKGYEPKAP